MAVALADGLDDGPEESGLEEARGVDKGMLVEVEVALEVVLPAVERMVDEVSEIGTCDVNARVVPAKVW